MGVAEQIGGDASLAAVFVLLTGLLGIVVMGPIHRLIRVADWRARGLSAGTAAHGLATARILMLSETAGAFGGLAIGINAVLTSLMVPILAKLLA
jgi:putative effector of murein hydrolase